MISLNTQPGTKIRAICDHEEIQKGRLYTVRGWRDDRQIIYIEEGRFGFFPQRFEHVEEEDAAAEEHN